jgi:hypothetical protein
VRETNAKLFERDKVRDSELDRRTTGRQIATLDVPEDLDKAVRAFKQKMGTLDLRREDEPEALVPTISEACHRLLETGARAAWLDDGWSMGIGAYVLRESFPYIMRSATMERIYARPLEVPLDYQAAERIIQGVPQGHGVLGEAMDRWFLQWELASILRACSDESLSILATQIRNWNSDAPYRAALLSSGTAPRIFDMLEELESAAALQLTCLDADLRALSQFGQKAVGAGFKDNCSFICDGALAGRQSQNPKRLPPQEFIVLPVLTQSRSRKEMLVLINEQYGNLIPGGALVLGLLRPSMPARFLAEVLLDWPVGHWHQDTLMEIVSESRFPAAMTRCVNKPDNHYFTVTLTREK